MKIVGKYVYHLMSYPSDFERRFYVCFRCPQRPQLVLGLYQVTAVHAVPFHKNITQTI